MKRALDSSESVGTVETPKGPRELCATAAASYDEGTGRLMVRLESFLRPTDLLVKEQHVRADWLPPNETVNETVSPDECRELAREIFRRWARKVREAAPRLHSV